MDTELLQLPEGRPSRWPALVPSLCGVAIAGSWVAGCLALIPWQG